MSDGYFCAETRADSEGRVWICLAPAGRDHIWDQVSGPGVDLGDYGGMST
tara:strand:- start:1590 stop:1739 length:150 start_codon:yes stop_codon:yes gene_type:complete